MFFLFFSFLLKPARFHLSIQVCTGICEKNVSKRTFISSSQNIVEFDECTGHVMLRRTFLAFVANVKFTKGIDCLMICGLDTPRSVILKNDES
jgi:hypothetical protein